MKAEKLLTPDNVGVEAGIDGITYEGGGASQPERTVTPYVGSAVKVRPKPNAAVISYGVEPKIQHRPARIVLKGVDVGILLSTGHRRKTGVLES